MEKESFDYRIAALMTAAENDQKTIIQLLIHKGVEVNSKDNNGITALMFAQQFPEAL